MNQKAKTVKVSYRRKGLYLIVCFFICCSVSKARDDQNNVDSWDAALVISGGISLGAYEAGLNWALIKILKDLGNSKENNVTKDNADKETTLQELKDLINNRKIKLMAVTGASAGGINALATVIHWCANEDLENSISDNLFKTIWMDVGIKELLPSEPDSINYIEEEGKDTNGVFSREPFRAPIKELKKKLAGAIFREDCDIKLGVTLTPKIPITVEIPGIDLPISIQSLKLPLQVVVDENSKMGFVPFPPSNEPTNYISLPIVNNKGKVSNDVVIDAFVATGAVPIAFGPVDFDYCHFGKSRDRNNKADCPPGKKGDSGSFIDGGVFDNIPLKFAMHLMGDEGEESEPNKKQKPIYYIFMDPDRRREITKPGNDTKLWTGVPDDRSITPIFPYEFRQQIRPLIRAVQTGRSSILNNTLIQYKWGEKRKLLLTNRYYPITGAMLGNFGAFLDKDFRELDYLI